jgi:oxygen-independent coproporphyrinogen III oxidase
VSLSPPIENRASADDASGSGACGLYIHTPFCETKCGYCDFYSVAMKDRDPAPLVSATIAELQSRVGAWGRPFQTIFLGGGTPTVLPTSELSRLLDALVDCVDVGAVEEFTVEANPATVDDETAKALVDHGVTRVSMGAQSFFADELATLERLHAPDDIAPSVETLRRHGVSNINLDLIFGIPGQTAQRWVKSLRRAIDLQVEHVACYGLTYEPVTRLTAQRNAGTVIPCDEDVETEMFVRTGEILADAGLLRYEISNYAKSGRACKHNLIYWRNGSYVGVGPSAAGCVGRRRYKNISDINGYVRMVAEGGSAEVESEELSRDTLILEIILMQLRLVEGISVAAFEDRIGDSPGDVFGDTLRRLVDQGLLEMSDTRVALTEKGMLVANAVMADLAAAAGSTGMSLPVIRQ